MRLYTFEVDVSNLPKTRDRFIKLEVKDRQRIANNEKNILFSKILNEEITTSELLEKDKEVRRLIHFQKMSSWEPFKKNYNRAFRSYLKGNWQKAHDYFKKCLLINPFDGPSKVLNEYILENNLDSASLNWKGYRLLTEK
uniref:Uncharacterized protein n=1 Tax=Euplotes harpa TaxID=151035 RepID=A0A7S3J422_9SPIT|mmetsp:Transcript_18960/g.21786  ORF Transcript_18960/g.21786 Transcript_18960/m.21786 type:complete len:140 (+) Transcript_18960:421-840(+)